MQESSVHIKAATKEADPVEITAEEAVALAKFLETVGKRADE